MGEWGSLCPVLQPANESRARRSPRSSIDFSGGVFVKYRHVVAAGGLPAAGMWWICAVGICACRASGAIFDIGRRPSIRLPSGRVCNHKSLPRPSSREMRLRKGRRKVGRRDPTPPLVRDDASETERPSLGRTQQRIELQMKTANFQRGSEVRWCAALDNPRGVLSIHISSWALSGASLEI